MVSQLKCPGAGRDAENPKAVVFYFDRPVSDDELRYLHEVMRRAAACNPTKAAERHLRLIQEQGENGD